MLSLSLSISCPSLCSLVCFSVRVLVPIRLLFPVCVLVHLSILSLSLFLSLSLSIFVLLSVPLCGHVQVCVQCSRSVSKFHYQDVLWPLYATSKISPNWPDIVFQITPTWSNLANSFVSMMLKPVLCSCVGVPFKYQKYLFMSR
jgi:hypothetical protein